MLSLGRVAVERSRFPEQHSPNSALQVSGQSLGRVAGTTDSELDLLVDLAGKAPGLILRPDELRFLYDALCRAVPSHSWCVSECFDRAGEKQHRSMRDLHSRRLRSRRTARPALPDRRIPAVWCGRARRESRECCTNGVDRGFARRVDESVSESCGNTIRTYTSKPGGPYRTRSHQSTSGSNNHRAASAAGSISVTLLSLVQRIRRRPTALSMPLIGMAAWRHNVARRRPPGHARLGHPDLRRPARETTRWRSSGSYPAGERSHAVPSLPHAGERGTPPRYDPDDARRDPGQHRRRAPWASPA
jgi:hypothetical protein